MSGDAETKRGVSAARLGRLTEPSFEGRTQMATTAPIVDRPRLFPPVEMLDDVALASRAGGGDERAFEEIYRRYQAPLYRYCASILGDRQEAEEVLQSAMFKAYKTLRESGRQLHLRAWLYRVAHNQCLDSLRRRRRAQQLSGLEEEGGLGVDEQVVLNEDLRQLRRDIAALDPEQRAALVLREMSGLSHVEIAQTLQATPAVAKQLIHDARRNLVAFESGRSAACEKIQRALSDCDGRVLRGGAITAHLRACRDCADFRAATRERGKRLRVLFPPLAPAAAQGIYATVVGAEGATVGGTLVTGGLAGGGLAGGFAVKLALIGAAAIVGTAAVGLPLGLADRIGHSDRPTAPTARFQGATPSPAASDGATLLPRIAGPPARVVVPGRGLGMAPPGTEPRAERAGRDRSVDATPELQSGTAVAVAGGPVEVTASADAVQGVTAASAETAGASARLRASAPEGSASMGAGAGAASAAVGAHGSSASGGASVSMSQAAGSVSVAGASADASTQIPVGPVEGSRVLP
jgi:RNA polymerase sigma factor (sigma-70 family)